MFNDYDFEVSVSVLGIHSLQPAGYGQPTDRDLLAVQLQTLKLEFACCSKGSRDDKLSMLPSNDRK